MDNPFGSAMADALAADTARLSGRKFADARGAGVARGVRTRRTMRAAGVGGVSAVAAGAIAFGATHLPSTGGVVAPATGGECTPTALVDIDAMWTHAADPRAHVIDSSESFDTETWYLYDDTLEMVVLKMVPMDAGLEVTYADGKHAMVAPNEAGFFLFEAPGGGYVTFNPNDSAHHAIWNKETVVGPSDVNVLADVVPPFDFQWTGCGLGSPAASVDASPSVDPSPLPTELTVTVVTRPEDVVAGQNPFQCGFVFPSDASETEKLYIEVIESTSVEYMNALLAEDPAYYGDSPPLAVGTAPVLTVTVRDLFLPSFGNVTSIGGSAFDPTTMEIVAPPSGFTVIQGASFVAVVEGRVVGTMFDPYSPQAAPPLLLVGTGESFDEKITLLNSETAFSSCPGIALGDDWTAYAVAGDMALDSAGRAYGPVYAWLKAERP